jgi:hypothetical protein
MHKTPPGPVVEEVCAAEITHLWRAGERLIRLAHGRLGGFAELPEATVTIAPAKAVQKAPLPRFRGMTS